jgi:D-ribose pyranose/furanose isomerase RbsD
MALKKHVDVDHVVIAKKIEEVNNHVTSVLETQLAKKDIMCPIMKYPNSWCKRSFKKDDV